MPGSRSNAQRRWSRRAGMTMAAAATVLIAVEAFAQSPPAPPVQLSKPQMLRPTNPTPAESQSRAAPRGTFGYKAGPSSRSVTTLPSVGAAGIQVDQLQSVDPDAAGILSAAAGGFGVDMWGGSSRPLIERLLAAVPANLSSPVFRKTLRRLLLSAATPPEGQAGGPSLAVRRLSILMAMADYAAALDLLSVMPRQGRGPELQRIQAELNFLTNDYPGACRQVGEEVLRHSADYWQKALIFCQALAGEQGKAELGLSLLRETGVEAPLFYVLADAMLAGEAPTLQSLDGLDGLTLSMIRVTKADMSFQAAIRSPSALRQVALSSRTQPEDRLNAAEFGAERGLFRADALKRAFEMPLPKAAPAAPSERSAAGSNPAVAASADAPAPLEDAGVVARARFYQAAIKTTVPVAKAEAISAALKSAMADSRLAGAARVFAPLIKTVAPSSDMLWFAPMAFRALALSGDHAAATAWLRLVRTNAAISEDSGKILSEMAPLAALFDPDNIVGGEAVPQPPGWSADQTILYLSILEALGVDVPTARWDGLIMRAQKPVILPDSVLWMRLRQLEAETPSAAVRTVSAAPPVSAAGIAVAGATVTAETLLAPTAGTRSGNTRLGERVLVMVLLVGDGSLAESNPLVIGSAIRGLRLAGLKAEARALAVEAAFGAGL